MAGAARAVIPPDLARRIAVDPRSYGPRIAPTADVLELFVPEVIFTGGDYLLALLAHAPAALVRPAPRQG